MINSSLDPAPSRINRAKQLVSKGHSIVSPDFKASSDFNKDVCLNLNAILILQMISQLSHFIITAVQPPS